MDIGIKKSKKALSIALSVILILGCMLGMTACGDAGSDANAPDVSDKPKLTVAISPDFSPMEFVDTSKTGQDQYVGFDITLANFIADKLGMELVLMPMSFDACQEAVANGDVDISISGYSFTPERAERFNLSDHYYAGENEVAQAIVVPADKGGVLVNAEDYAGLKVGAQVSSMQLSLAKNQLPESTTIVEFENLDDAVEALLNGELDGLAVARGHGKAIIANHSELALSGFEFTIAVQAANNVVLIQKGNDELTEKINACLKEANEKSYYVEWYTEAQELAGIDTAADVSYDAEGNAQ